MIKVYVAGKYSDNNVLGVLGNIAKGIQVCKDLFLNGYAPFCPWLDHQFILCMTKQEREKLTVEMFQRYSLEWLEQCDCMLVIKDMMETSQGTQQEIIYATQWGIPIFYSLDEFYFWANILYEGDHHGN